MFASKSPRDLNGDPKPYCGIFTGLRYAAAPAGTDYYLRHEPRPEFDAVQHNEPNPVLLDFRKSGKSATEYQHHALLNGYPSVYHFEIEHARKVLSRLSRLEEK